MPIYTLTTPGGARCQIHSDGAQVTSWVPAGGGERLFLSPRSAFGPGASIRGGAPVIFPQFNAWGAYARHGFARRLPWTFLSQAVGADGRASARFELRQSEATLAEWPFDFHCQLEVNLGQSDLEIQLRVENSGQQPFSFSAALHTYFAVRDLDALRLLGLQGAAFLDCARDGKPSAILGKQTASSLGFAGEVDRIYFGAPGRLELRDAGRGLVIEQSGFSDTVVWNPGAVKGGALNDLEPGGWRRFVCVEAALIDPPVILAPSGDWSGCQRLSTGK
jgi:glucose-6-phosphate 1-epimerase